MSTDETVVLGGEVMTDGITRGYRHETHNCKKLLSSSQSNIGNDIPRTLASGRLSSITLRELYVENSLGWGAWHRSIPMNTWIESSSQPTLMIGPLPHLPQEQNPL